MSKVFKLAGLLAAVAGSSLLMSAPASASQDREFGDIYSECGIGALIAPHHPVVAIVTNVTWDLGTTALTSDITDFCNVDHHARTAALIYSSYPELEKNLAAGNGEHLTALLTAANIDSDKQRAVTAEMRKQLATAATLPSYSTLTRYQHAEAMYDSLQAAIAAIRS